MKEKELERTLKALANRRRLVIISYLKKQKEANVGEIAEHIHLSFKSTSRHLSVLANTGILDREQRSSEAYYKLGFEIPDAANRIIYIL